MFLITIHTGDTMAQGETAGYLEKLRGSLGLYEYALDPHLEHRIGEQAQREVQDLLVAACRVDLPSAAAYILGEMQNGGRTKHSDNILEALFRASPDGAGKAPDTSSLDTQESRTAMIEWGINQGLITVL